MSEQAEHSAAKRQQIIEGAERVFTECGFEGASMSRIAAEAGVAKGTLYNYFSSKSVLFGVFVEQKAERCLAHIFQTASDEQDVAMALRTIALRMLEMLVSEDNLALYRIVVSEAVKFPHLATKFWKSGPYRAITYMTGWIERQIALGLLAAADPQFAAEQFLALCQTRLTIQRRLQIQRQTNQEDVEIIVSGAVRLFLAGYSVERLPPTMPQSVEKLAPAVAKS